RKKRPTLQESSSILLRNITIAHLKELQWELPKRDRKDTFDELIVQLITFYRKKKKMDELWNQPQVVEPLEVVGTD
ncbi:MAG: hypothetical protein ACRD8W_32665, partial [Nitrososphaeraceae archaeon]